MQSFKTTNSPSLSYPASTLKHRPSLLSRFLSSKRTVSSTIAEKPTIYTPYIPTHAAPSFLSSTTPVTLEERYHSKQLTRLQEDSTKPEDKMTITERSEAMRERGRARGEIRLDLLTY